MEREQSRQPFPGETDLAGESAISRRLSRRETLRIGLAMAALPLAAACGQQTSPSQSKPAEVNPSGGVKPAAPAAPAASQAAAPAASARGTGGALKILMWQSPTILNPHLSQGTKDYIAARFCCEPLITINGQGEMSPVLAAEVPSQANGGISDDGKTVTYKLKKDVKWADGQPFTADDVVFTFKFATDKESAAVTAGTYQVLEKVEAIDSHTVRLVFKEATAGWYSPFAGTNGQILPKHALEEYIGANSRTAPFNTKAFGTGPYMVEDFVANDQVIYSVNPHYREPNKPYFSRVEIKGGGDATSAARAVLETGEYDYAWNLAIEAQVLEQILRGGKGELVAAPGLGVEQIYFNMADPNQVIDGERSSPKSTHPFLTDIKVREAMALAVDRETMAKQLYGPTGTATANVLTTPINVNSPNTKYEFNIEKANRILDEAGYKRGSDGIRVTPSGVRMKVVFQTTINSLRQKQQALIKDGWQKIGVETELKMVDAGVFFSSDPSNPDTNGHFTADVSMFTSTFDSPYALGYMKRFYAADLERDWAQQSNKWAPPNFMKWRDEEFNKLYEQAKTEQDPMKLRETFVKMNDIVVNSYVDIPLVDKQFADGKAKSLKGPAHSPFDCQFAWNIADWTRG